MCVFCSGIYCKVYYALPNNGHSRQPRNTKWRAFINTDTHRPVSVLLTLVHSGGGLCLT